MAALRSGKRWRDALIDVSCTSGSFNAAATGTVITFKNRQEAMKAPREINAILK